MSKCVFRTDLKQRPVGQPLVCVDAMEMFSYPGIPTVEQGVHLLVATDEISLGLTDKRTVMNGPKVVGHIHIVDDRVCARWVAARGLSEGL